MYTRQISYLDNQRAVDFVFLLICIANVLILPTGIGIESYHFNTKDGIPTYEENENVIL